MKSIGCPTKHIAWIMYKDRSEKGQRRVRAMFSYMKKKALLNDSESGSITQQTTEQNSWVDIVSKLRKRKNFTVSRLWSKGYPVGMIALLLYGDDSEQSQNRVYAHISKFRKGCGCDFPEQNLRSGVGVMNFTNKTCDQEFGVAKFPNKTTAFGSPTPTPNRNQHLSVRYLLFAMEEVKQFQHYN